MKVEAPSGHAERSEASAGAFIFMKNEFKSGFFVTAFLRMTGERREVDVGLQKADLGCSLT
jgi:hypothetical protein